MDMDGVLVHEEQAIPGADRFIKALQAAGLPFLVLTNNSIYTQRDLAARLARSGIELAPERIWTSALATAQFSTRSVPVGPHTRSARRGSLPHCTGGTTP
jgi:NagD protein